MAPVTLKVFAAVVIAAFFTTVWCAEGTIGGTKASAGPNVLVTQTDQPVVDDFEGEELPISKKKGLKSKKNAKTKVILKGKNLAKDSAVVAHSPKGVWVGSIINDLDMGKKAEAEIKCLAHTSNGKGFGKPRGERGGVDETEMVTVTVTNDDGGASVPKTKSTETENVP